MSDVFVVADAASVLLVAGTAAERRMTVAGAHHSAAVGTHTPGLRKYGEGLMLLPSASTEFFFIKSLTN